MAGAIVFTVVCALQLGVGSWLGDRLYPGISVADLQLSGLSRHQAREALTKKIEGYHFTLAANGKQYTARPEDAGVSYDVDATLQQAYTVGHSQWLSLIGLFQSTHQGKLQYAYRVDERQQKAYVRNIVSQVGKEATDATVVVENGQPRAQSDVNGVGLSEQQVSEAINQQVATLNAQPSDLKSSPQPARIKVADVQPAIEKTKTLLAVPVTITYNGKSFKPTAAQMGEWLSYAKSSADAAPAVIPTVNLDGIKHYLQSIAVQINANPVNKKVVIENGVSRVDREGATGLQLDQDTLADQIATQFKDGNAYTGGAPVKSVPFQTETNRIVTLNYGKYIEINLSRQHLWVYQDGKVIFESPITSGATGAGFPTVQGLFSVQAKQTNRNLNGYAIGYNYNVFVKYWMPFYGNYGLHDASWRSSFGGSDYYYGGSHGCVNLPDSTAAFLYGWADVGTPVWVHS